MIIVNYTYFAAIDSVVWTCGIVNFKYTGELKPVVDRLLKDTNMLSLHPGRYTGLAVSPLHS